MKAQTIPINELVWTPEQAAEKLNVSRITIKRWCAGAEIHCVKIGAKVWRIPDSGPAALLAWSRLPDELATSQVEEILALHKNTVNRLIQSGDLPAHRVGRNWKVSKAELMGLLGLQAK